jgi:hypothetical protein
MPKVSINGKNYELKGIRPIIGSLIGYIRFFLICLLFTGDLIW